MNNSTAVIILAAGKGKRMNSPKAKVLHEISGKPMIRFVIDSAIQVAGEEIILVVGNQAEQVKSVVSSESKVRFACQENQLGTGHAVLCALPEVSEHVENVVILCGDVPLIQPETLEMLIGAHVSDGNAITILGAHLDNPFGYGRLIQDNDGDVVRIVEEADASATEKAVKLINTGIYCVNRGILGSLLALIKTNNAQKEMYLTDIVSLAAASRKRIGMVPCPDTREMIGVNTQEDLERVEAVLASFEKP